MNLRNAIREFEKGIFNPLKDLFQLGGTDQLKKELEFKSDIEKLDFFYDKLEAVLKAKSQADYLLWTAKYNSNLDSEELEDADFNYNSDGLLSFELFLKSEIEILENKSGIRYWKPNDYKATNKNRKTNSYKIVTELDEIQTAFLFKVLYEHKLINPEYKKDIAAPVYALTGYSEEGIRQKLSNPTLDTQQTESLISKLKQVIVTIEKTRK